MPEYIDETHQRISEFASEFLEEDERDDFVDSLLERRGYQRATRWLPPEPEGGGGRKPLVKPGSKGAGGGKGGGRGSYFGGGGR